MEDITQKFDRRIKNPEPHIVALLAEIDGMRGEFKSGLRMSPQAIINLKKLIDGKDVMKILKCKEGEKIGAILKKIRKLQIENKITTREEALEFLKKGD